MLRMANRVTRKLGALSHDVASELVLKVFAKGKQDKPPGYIYQMMTNGVLDFYDRQKSREKYFDDSVCVVDDVTANSQDETYDNAVLPQTKNKEIELLNVLLMLERSDQELLFAMLMSDFFVSEAAEILNRNYQATRRSWINLKNKLRRMYEKAS